MNSLLEFHSVSRRFGRAKALKDASFRVPAGSITALLGPNGAGKSTALKIALNLLRPGSGSATVLGTDSRKLGPAEFARIGYVADGMEMPEWMTAPRAILAPESRLPVWPGWMPWPTSAFT